MAVRRPPSPSQPRAADMEENPASGLIPMDLNSSPTPPKTKGSAKRMGNNTGAPVVPRAQNNEGTHAAAALGNVRKPARMKVALGPDGEAGLLGIHTASVCSASSGIFAPDTCELRPPMGARHLARACWLDPRGDWAGWRSGASHWTGSAQGSSQHSGAENGRKEPQRVDEWRARGGLDEARAGGRWRWGRARRRGTRRWSRWVGFRAAQEKCRAGEGVQCGDADGGPERGEGECNGMPAGADVGRDKRGVAAGVQAWETAQEGLAGELRREVEDVGCQDVDVAEEGLAPHFEPQ
ncbi:hypothetical protein K438DRAFT_1791544 [Mycena galopus ATCC 62051]|nr:hypothetical protein K438DRAFT_1791544 [Mycena galopus ATCC 62051]